jgi:predicted acylesterase/phospholipase RssA
MTQRKKALALAGGGPVGGIYELGALLALDEVLEGGSLLDFDIFVGVSSGAFFAAGLANGMSPMTMYELFIENDDARSPDALEPEMLLRPAFGEFYRRMKTLPGLLWEATASYLEQPFSHGHFLESFQRLSWAIPTGLFNNASVEKYLAHLFSGPGRTNDFRRLKHQLFLVATDLDSGDAVAFGAPGTDDVPISRAVQASAALPGLFPPVLIGGRNYVDGVLRKTLHASVALKEGAGLLIGINPLVPFRERRDRPRHETRGTLEDRGLALVLSQTFRAIIHSRMQVGMARYAAEYPDADVLLFEPARDDAKMFFINVFSFSERRELSQHAYQQTREQLRRHADRYDALLRQHGLGLNRNVLFANRNEPILEHPLGHRPRPSLTTVTKQLNDTLDHLQLVLERQAKTVHW